MNKNIFSQLLYLLLLTAVLVITFVATAQDKIKPFRLQAGIQTAVPVSKHFAESHSVGFGPYLDAEYRFSNRVGVAARLGYDYFLGKKYTYTTDYTPGYEPVYTAEGKYDGAGVVNFTGGVRYHPTDNFYTQAFLGLSAKKWDAESKTRPLIGGGAGYSFPIGSEQKARELHAGLFFFGMCEASFLEFFIGIPF